MQQVEDAVQQLVAVGAGDAHAHAHLHHQRVHAQHVQGVGQGALQHGGAGVHPDEVAVELHGVGQKIGCGLLRDAHLGDLPQEDVAGVHVDAQFAALDVLHDARGGELGHCAVLAAGEDAVHVQIEARHAAGDGVHAQRVQRRVDVHDAVEQLRTLTQAALQLVADVLALQLVAVGAGHDADALQVLRRMCGHDAHLLHAHLLIHRQVHGNQLLYQGCPSSLIMNY